MTVDANIVSPMKLMEMADASSGRLIRNCTPGLMAPAGGPGGAVVVAAEPGRTDRGSTTAQAAVRRRRSTPHASPYAGRLLLGHQHGYAEVPALPELYADLAERVELRLGLDALGEHGGAD